MNNKWHIHAGEAEQGRFSYVYIFRKGNKIQNSLNNSNETGELELNAEDK